MKQIWQQVVEFMVDTVQFYPPADTDKYGKPTFGAVVNVKGRLSNAEAKTRTIQGREVTDSGKFICYGPQPSITTAWKMVVGGVEYNIHNTNSVSDENGIHHTDILFGV